MTWTGSTDAPPTARISALLPLMHPGERRVAEAVAADLGAAVERSAQQVADDVGVGRATVVRAAQTLGYEGYPQLRVAAARELALRTTADAPADGTMLGVLRESVARFAARLGHTVSGLTEQVLQEFVAALDDAGRVLVVANGLSSPLGLDLVLRLTSAGRPAELLQDALAQRIAARQLGPDAVCLVVSGSGTNDATLAVMRAAHDGGTPVLAITSFAQSPVAQLADTVLVVPPVNDSFRDELVHTSRAALMLVTEALVEALVARRGDRGRDARAVALDELGSTIQE
ncbi:RpiR family transcriptional regulator [Isoptericola sp. CG 20/1183]|uniref:RpiR family transcriptional regulator n=1 Tax=Isoptericola halotolerans TaxID=300560 RepID=A0ABX5EDB9_9MICO|nr:MULTISPECIES: MurR/RpiR family transcriptional regulator [Isoptericola]PRZ03867.1 RpiR family transcriptional regulator [Isoptericola sp. CG 20/1183]PRZ04000.1 RpiR family transcriptional regulator [Isoptericola halotolerans]